MVKRGD